MLLTPLLALLPGVVVAQDHTLSVELVGGPAIPTGNTAQASGLGVAAGFGLIHRMSRRLAVTTDFQLSHFSAGAFVSADDESELRMLGGSTDLSMWRATVGLTVRTTGAESPWQLNLRGGLGVAGIGSDPLPQGSQESTEPFFSGLNEDVLAVTGGLEISRRMTRDFSSFARVQVDAYDLGDNLFGLSLLNSDVTRSGWLVGFPLQLGVRIGF